MSLSPSICALPKPYTQSVSQAEGELRALLGAVERQKANSAAKMRQLATLITDLG